MPYQVTYTESNNPAKPAITVADGVLNGQTSMQFVGKGYVGFAPVYADNFLHLLENFASPSDTPPTNPVEGQLWYDNTNKVIKVYDGTTWSPAGALRKAITPPTNAITGDLWVDTSKSQLFVYSGSNWVLVGPQFSSGTLTGPIVDEIVDVSNVTHNVLSLYANNYRIAVISKEAFVPKAAIAGFDSINQGFNISSVDATSSTAPTRMWGTARSADALLVNAKEVLAANFLRSDVPSTSNTPLTVRHDGGINIGSTSSFNIGINGSNVTFASNSTGTGIDFKLNNAGTVHTVLHMSPNAYIGIGDNNTSPASELDVAGLITASTGLNVTGTTDSTLLGNGSIVTAGGLSVAKSSNFGGSMAVVGQITVDHFVGSTPTGTVLQPGVSNAYDLGSNPSTGGKQFRNIYAQSFVGSFSGTLSGTLNGDVNGSAGKLASPTTFSIDGDVTSTNDITFDGQGDNPAVFHTQINSGIITSRVAATDSVLTDQFLIYRPGTTSLLSISKAVLLNHVATVPIGTIFPFAGTVIPTGYVLCDGAEVEISKFTELYRVIGNTYKTPALLQGMNTFGLPDYRGRFPLGADNMNNGFSVPSRNGSGTLINTILSTANRVVDAVAKIIGAGGSIQSAAGTTSQVPYATTNYIIFTGVL